MAIISDADLDAFRDLAEELALKDDCTIKRNTTGVSDGLGTRTQGLTPIATVKAYVARPSADPSAGQLLAPRAGKIGSQLTWQVSLPYATDVQEEDILLVDGKTMTVLALLDPSTYSVFTVVIASEVL